MHIGHMALFRELGEHGAIVVIESGYANLTPKAHRRRYTKYPFLFLDLRDIKNYSGEEFIRFLNGYFKNLKKIVVGYDFHFGKDRRCSFLDLKKLFHGEVVVVNEVSYMGDSVHSHKVRLKLGMGDIKGANAFLGRNYSVEGVIVKGQGIGHKELVATINIDPIGFLLPMEGVYVTLSRVDDEEHFHPSVSFVGHRVSTDGSFAVETHLLDGEIVCQEKAVISFVDFIRPNKKFESINELRVAIKKDIAVAQRELKFLQI